MFCSILIIYSYVLLCVYPYSYFFFKQKVSRKYKIRAKNRIYEAFIRSMVENIDVHQELDEFDID